MKRLEMDKSIVDDQRTAAFTDEELDFGKVVRAAREGVHEAERLAAANELLTKLRKLNRRLQESEQVTLELTKAIKVVAENRPPRTAEEAMLKVHRSG